MKKILLITLTALFFTACFENKSSSQYEPTSKLFVKKVYKLGIHPYLNSKKMFISYRPILDYLESNIDDVEFILETSAFYSDYNEKLYNREFHFSLPNPYQTYNSLKYNYKVIGKMKPDSVFRGIFVARKDSNLKSILDLKGKTVSFPAPTALAATMMPLYYLYENGLDVKRDISQKFVGSQYSSILNAYSRDTIAGATWPPPWIAWSKENPQKAKEMEVVWETESLINNGFIVRDDIDEDFANRVIDLLVALNNTSKGRKLLSDAGFAGFERATNERYLKIENFLSKYDKAIGIPK